MYFSLLITFTTQKKNYKTDTQQPNPSPVISDCECDKRNPKNYSYRLFLENLPNLESLFYRRLSHFLQFQIFRSTFYQVKECLRHFFFLRNTEIPCVCFIQWLSPYHSFFFYSLNNVFSPSKLGVNENFNQHLPHHGVSRGKLSFGNTI